MKHGSGIRGLENAYSDSPQIHSNLLISSLQILVWVLFHPSAWRNHTARINPPVTVTFSLSDLDSAHFKSWALRRVLASQYIVLPLMLGALVAGILFLIGVPAKGILVGVTVGMSNFILYTLAAGLLVSVGIAALPGVLWGLSSGLVFGILAGEHTNDNFDIKAALTFGVSIGILTGIIELIANNIFGIEHDSAARKIAGIVLGTIVGGAITAAVGTLNYFITFNSYEVDKVSFWLLMFSGMYGLSVGKARGWKRGIRFGVTSAILTVLVQLLCFNVYVMAVGRVTFGASNGVLYSALAVFTFMIANRVAGPSAAAYALGLGAGGGWIALILVTNGTPTWPSLYISLGCILLAHSLTYLRNIVFYPFSSIWNTVLFYADKNSSNANWHFLRWHTAFWDELQPLRLYGLDEHLLTVIERNPTEGYAALSYLATSRQRWAAQAVQIELDARKLEGCLTVQDVASVNQNVHANELQGPASTLLRSVNRISLDVNACLRQESAYNQRLALTALEDRLDGLVRELTRSSEEYAARFYPIASHWRTLISKYLEDLSKEIELRQEIENPYIIGVPLTEQQEIFVGRTDITARVEHLLLDRRRPPLLLYGQRRMGKTSLLNNLGRLLPTSVIPLFVDLQGPASQARDHAGFLYNLSRSMVDSALRQRGITLTRLSRDQLAGDPFTAFDEWLDTVERAMGQGIGLLTLDEFEVLNNAFAEGRLNEQAILGTFRHWIQHRARFKIMLAGSHTLNELQQWSTYLINVQTLHVGCLSERETLNLIERPISDFSLRYEPEAPQLIYRLTRGHPFLVQLLCSEIVALKNEQPPSIRRLGRVEDVEAAIPEAMAHGSLFFADIEHNQMDADAAKVLRLVASKRDGRVTTIADLVSNFGKEVDSIIERLLRRDLIEAVDDGYVFQIELVRRWFQDKLQE